ncbi:MAG: two-component regulator propeller domain-containing protein [Ferruginibacter sp.]
MNSVKTHYLILLLALCLLASSTAKSQINQGRTSRYYVEHYGQEEGLPQNSVNNLFPDANGFIWVATESGIARFNGNRFIPVPVKKGIGNISFARVKNFYAKGKDTIMAYSAAGHSIAFIVNNEIVASEKHFYPKHGLLFSTLHQPVQAPSFLLDNVPGEGIRLHWDISKGMYNGTVYNKDTFLVILYGGLGVFNNKGLINKIEIDNLNASRMVYVNGRALYLDDQNYINLYSVMSLQQRQPLPISAKKIKIFNNSYGNNFFCVADSVLYRVDVNATGQMKTVRILDNLQNADDITTVYEKDSNSIAIGTLRNGLYVYKRKCFTVSDVLPPGESDVFYVQQLLDDNQTIFTGGNKLFKENIYLGKTKFTVYNHPYSSLKDSKGDYWFAYGNKIISTKTIGGTAADTLLQYGDGPGMFFEDKAGRVWFSSTTKFGYFLNRKFTEVQISNFKGGTISYIEQDINGRYLLGTREGLFILNTINDTTVQEVPALRSLDIRFLLPEANGQIWVCTYGHGFFLLDKDNVTSFTDGGGNLAYVHCLIEDSNGNFWMPTNNGLFVTSRQSLMAYVKNKNMPPYYYEFSKRMDLELTNSTVGMNLPIFVYPMAI